MAFESPSDSRTGISTRVGYCFEMLPVLRWLGTLARAPVCRGAPPREGTSGLPQTGLRAASSGWPGPRFSFSSLLAGGLPSLFSTSHLLVRISMLYHVFVHLKNTFTYPIWDPGRKGQKLTQSFHRNMETCFWKFSGVQSRCGLELACFTKSFSYMLFLHISRIRSLYTETVFHRPCVVLLSIYSPVCGLFVFQKLAEWFLLRFCFLTVWS